MNMSLRQRTNVTLGLFALGAGVLYRFSPTHYGFYPPCPFHALTGLQCPGCGGTRALYQMLHLNFREALQLNALITVAVPIALVWLCYWYYSVMRYHRSPEFRVPRGAMLCFSVIVLAFTVVRNSGLGF
jgi:hypothetical protein